MLWPYAPATVEETLNFATELLRAKGGEERVARRSLPVIRWAFSHPLDPDQTGAASALVRANTSGVWRVGRWPARQVVGPLVNGATVLSVAAASEFSIGDAVGVWTGGVAVLETTISGATPVSVTLADALPVDVTTGHLAPIVSAIERERPRVVLEAPTSGLAQLSVEEEAPRTGPREPLASYQGEPLLFFAPALEPGVSGSLGLPRRFLGGVLGRTDSAQTRIGIDAVRAWTLRASDRSELRSILAHLYAVRGAQASFWAPTWAEDLEITATAVAPTTVIRVRRATAPPNMTGRSLALRTDAGLEARSIVGESIDGIDLVLTLDVALSADLAPGQARLSLLTRVRLETGQVQISHDPDGFSDISLSLREIPAAEAERVSTGTTVFFYTFARDGTVLRYTSASQSITIGADVFQEETLLHGAIRASARTELSSLTLTMPLASPLGDALASVAQSSEWSVIIQRTDTADLSDLRAIWQGFVGASRTRGQNREIALESSLSMIGRKGVAPRLSRKCQHVLYSQVPGSCGVNRADHTTGATATAGSGRVFTVPEAATLPELASDATYLVNGSVTWAGERRPIEVAAGDQVTLLDAWPELADAIAAAAPSPVPIEISGGCNKLLGTCGDRFDNTDNFGGTPHLPETELFGGSVF